MKIIKVSHEEEFNNSEAESIREIIKDFEKKKNPSIMQFIQDTLKTGVASIIPMIGITVLIKKIIDLISEYKCAINAIDQIKEQLDKIHFMSMEKAMRDYPHTQDLATGYYTIHPKDRLQLFPLEDYHKKLNSQRENELITIFAKMGAKQVLIQDITDNSTQATGSVGGNYADFGASVQGGVKDKNTKSKDIVMSYAGNKTTIPKDLLTKSIWYKTDSRLNGLLDSRIYEENQVMKYHYESEYSESFNFDFDVAAKYLEFGANIKAEYEKQRKSKKLFTVEFA